MISYTYKKRHNNSIKNDYLLDNIVRYVIIYMLVGYFNFDWGLLWLGITLHAKNAGVSSEFSFTEKYLKEIG